MVSLHPSPKFGNETDIIHGEIANAPAATNIHDAINDHKPTTQRLRTPRSIFREIADIFDKEFEGLDKIMQPFSLASRGTATLPDDVLAIIFGLVEDVEPLAATCRKFRQITLRLQKSQDSPHNTCASENRFHFKSSNYSFSCCPKSG